MDMDRTRWQILSELLDEALALPPEARPAWLEALRLRDPGLLPDMQALLRPAANQGYDPRTTVPSLPPPGMHPERGAGTARVFTPGKTERTVADLSLQGLRMGPWELLSKIGEGGMGQVWLARRADGLYQAQAAIKLLRSDLKASALQTRFARERAVLARLNHPAIARLLDAGISHGQAYLVLEFVEGSSLSEHVREHCSGLVDRVRLLLRIAEAVDHAHAQLIVHRDLKPSNVMVTAGGVPKLLDFGIAGLLDEGESDAVQGELTRQSGRGLTLGYAAPEQIMGQPISVAADVFSLGVMLYELCSGQLPYTARHAPRQALEYAVLHEEPRRLSNRRGAERRELDSADIAHGPGRPADLERVRGDLEAIVMKALRREPGARYGSVRLLMEDLEAWLAHRPVTAQRDDWRHRSRLWLRRNALVAGGTAALLASLAVGLSVSTWQWRRAEAAAKQSTQVTAYLRDLLASASPEQHGGTWPTVLQLLEDSRAKLPEKFRDDPDTRRLLLEVMGDTYHDLNRFDVSIPLREELVALSTERLGADDRRTLDARLQLARSQQVQGQCDKSLATLEALRDPFGRAFGVQSEDYRTLLYVMNGCLTRLGRFDDADRNLANVGKLTEAMYPAGSEHRLSHQNHLASLRMSQGRMREGREALRQTEAWWNDPKIQSRPIALVLRRNTIAAQLRMSAYGGLQETGATLLADMDRLLGQGNDMAAGMRVELARALSESGQVQAAQAMLEDQLARAQAAKVQNPDVLLPLQARVLAAKAKALGAPPAVLKAETRQLLGVLRQRWSTLGYPRGEATLNLARVALALDDAALANEVLAPLRADTSEALRRDRLLMARLAQLEGGLARLQGDLPRSRQQLEVRQAMFGPAADQQQYTEWAAGLDLAWTLVLLRDPQAATALQAAAQRRPPGVPAQHTLDAVHDYLRACLANPAGTESPAARAALQTLRQRQGGAPSSGSDAANLGLGSFSGAFI